MFLLHSVALRCAECPSDPPTVGSGTGAGGLVLCPDCFSSGAAPLSSSDPQYGGAGGRQHRAEHGYTFEDNGGYSLMGAASDWTAKEHLR